MKQVGNALTIDETRLDEEWVRQARLYFYWAKKLARSRLLLDKYRIRVDIAKDELDRTAAELDLEIRKDPKSFDLKADKITESAIKNKVMIQKEYILSKKELIQAQRKLIKKKHEVDILQSVTHALDHKKAALENLVRLHGQNYFSGPQANDNEKTRQISQDLKKNRARSKGKKK